jgi:hypothetical protein
VGKAINVLHTRENKNQILHCSLQITAHNFFFPKKSASDNTLVWNLTFQTKPSISGSKCPFIMPVKAVHANDLTLL